MAFTAQQSFQVSNASATTAAVALEGGTYAGTIVAAGFGTTVQLQTLAIDGTTWLNVGSNLTANGYTAYANLPAGQYRLNISGASGVYFALTRVPA
jgi:hypothetical protein